MYYYEAKAAFKDIVKYLDTEAGQKDLEKLAKIWNSCLKNALKNALKETNESFYLDVRYLIDEIEKNKTNAVILILKNKNSLFDMFIFEEEVSFASINVTSSETFQDAIRKNPVDGFIIENINAENILIFLKSYYIYRKDPGVSQVANNMVNEYSYESLEMASISEKFLNVDEENVLSLKSIIVYDDDALPYSLNYLDKEHEDVQKLRKYNNCYTFYNALINVGADKFIGMSLKKYKR